jgi:hypothetical protein
MPAIHFASIIHFSVLQQMAKKYGCAGQTEEHDIELHEQVEAISSFQHQQNMLTTPLI